MDWIPRRDRRCPSVWPEAISLSKCVFLDTGVLGYVTHPRPGEEGRECKSWLAGLLTAGVRVCVPEIFDYELRREYEHRRATKALRNLNDLGRAVDYIAIRTEAMHRAAVLWGDTRRAGLPTAGTEALDGDVIACAQAILERKQDEELIFATTNVGHLSRFLVATVWREVAP
jgi:predicted nucleic acid-binding protein